MYIKKAFNVHDNFSLYYSHHTKLSDPKTIKSLKSLSRSLTYLLNSERVASLQDQVRLSVGYQQFPRSLITPLVLREREREREREIHTICTLYMYMYV